MKIFIRILLSLLSGSIFLIPNLATAQFQPAVAFVDADGRMNYQRDAEGNRIPDFSHAGYRGGGIDLPNVATVLTLNPIPGDNTAHIQAGIDSVSSLTPDADGFRGALLLNAGRYEIHGILHIETSGVVLRGVGDGADTLTNTVLIGVGNVPNQRDILVLGGGSDTRWGGRVENTATFLNQDSVLVGETQFQIEKPENFQLGDNIVIYHPCTQEWLDAIEGGGGVSEGPWTVASQPLSFNRRIVGIDDSLITVDVPVYNTLVRALSPSFAYVYDRAGMVSEVGVEDLRIEIETAGGTDEDHAWNAVGLVQVEDAWVTGCSFLYFGLAGVYTATANRITIADCEALDPVAEVTGARMYNFNLLAASSQVLVKDCYASNGRHHYVSNGTSSVSGCVFLNCTSDAAYNASEGHRRWSMGLLYDNLVEINVRNVGGILLGLYNRGDYGTAHGWSAAHSVAWNCNMGGAQLIVQKPPTAQNYAIACKGQVSGSHRWPGTRGFIEGTGEMNVLPASLYEAQLTARLAGLEELVTDVAGTSVVDKGVASPWQIYPNPSQGILRVKASQQGPFKLIVWDKLNRKIKTFEGNGSGEWDLSSIASGPYLIEIQQKGEVSYLRWLKQ